MDKILVVTSFSENGFNLYGKRFTESFKANWPANVKLACFHHSNFNEGATWQGPAPEEQVEGVDYLNLDLIPELIPFKNQVAQLLQQKVGSPYPQVPWQLDAVKFTNKVFALAAANTNWAGGYDWIIWLDADTVTNKPISMARLKHWLHPKADVVHLGRTSAAYSETSFVGYNTKGGKGLACYFINDLMWTFLSGEFQHYQEWHDGFIFERLLNLSKQHGLVTKNLSQDVHGTLEAFMSTELGHFMNHMKGNRKHTQIHPNNEPQGDPNRMAFKVNPKDCVPQKEIKENILKNIRYIKQWIAPCKSSDKEVIFASGGPSLKKYLTEIKRRQDEEGAVVFSVKHSYPVLMEAGIRPDFCVIIDPRTIEGVSTHGHNRKELFKTLHPDSVFLVSSMAHHSVAPFFTEKGAKVVGWHAATGELMDILPRVKSAPEYRQAVTIGTCSAIRGIGIAKILGFSKVTLVGYDSSLGGPPNNPNELLDTGMLKYYQVSLSPDTGVQVFNLTNHDAPVKEGEKRYWTTGELIALYQDFIGIIPHLETPHAGYEINVMADDTTLIGYGWQILKQAQQKDKEKKQLFEMTGPSLYDVLNKPQPPLEFAPDLPVV